MSVDQWQINQRLTMKLDLKVAWTKHRITEWYNHWHGKVYIAFSGGKDSTVLRHIARQVCDDIPCVFVNTGLEYPEIIKFVKSLGDVEIIKPKLPFWKVIEKYGWPLVSKDQAAAIHRYRTAKSPEHKRRRLEGFPNGKKGTISKKWRYLLDAPFKISEQCCNVMKKAPLDAYARRTGRYPITGMMASDSQFRLSWYRKNGCNAFEIKNPKSMPMAIWTTDDVWAYIRQHNVEYCSVYDKGCLNTGCTFCAFGLQYDGCPNRFQLLQHTHPKLWRYCMHKLKMSEVLDFMGVPWEISQEEVDRHLSSCAELELSC